MEIYQLLTNDHNEVKKMLNKLVSFDEDTDNKEVNDLISKIRDELIPHARAEEAVLYNSLRDLKESRDLVKHGYIEHVQAETLLRTLQLTGRIDAGWIRSAEKLKDALEHHILEEEGDIFTAAKQNFTDDEAEMMGEAFQKLKPDIKEEGMIATSLELVANIMPSRFAKAFRSFNLESRIQDKK